MTPLVDGGLQMNDEGHSLLPPRSSPHSLQLLQIRNHVTRIEIVDVEVGHGRRLNARNAGRKTQ